MHELNGYTYKSSQEASLTLFGDLKEILHPIKLNLMGNTIVTIVGYRKLIKIIMAVIITEVHNL